MSEHCQNDFYQFELEEGKVDGIYERFAVSSSMTQLLHKRCINVEEVAESGGYLITVVEGTKNTRAENAGLISNLPLVFKEIQDVVVPAFKSNEKTVIPTKYTKGGTEFQIQIGKGVFIRALYKRYSEKDLNNVFSINQLQPVLGMKYSLIQREKGLTRKLLVASLPHNLQDHLLLCDLGTKFCLDVVGLRSYTVDWVWQSLCGADSFRRAKASSRKTWRNFGAMFNMREGRKEPYMLIQFGYRDDSYYPATVGSQEEKSVKIKDIPQEAMAKWKSSLQYFFRRMVADQTNPNVVSVHA